jgi:hypothetical protein
MSIPKQVQEQLEAADRIEAEILAAQQPPAPELEAQPTAPPAEENAAPAAEPETPPAPEPEAATPTPSPEEETWERRFKTLKGKYDAEVPRLTAELKELRRDLAALTAAAKEKAEAPKKPEPLVNEKDVETFGSDLLDVIDRKAQEVARSLVGTEMAELKAENLQLREQLDGVAERQVVNDRRGYFAELERLVPDWEAVNVDEGFLGWLAEADPLSGRPRQDYLNSAFESHDVERTAALFSTYKQLTAPPATKPARQELERQVAPGSSKATPAAPPSQSEKLWTLREIELFYQDVSKGAYRDKPDEARRIENEIDLAVASGRIRQ